MKSTSLDDRNSDSPFEVYFSHSFRDQDREINSYFIRLFDDEDISLVADKKQNTWCVPKLERYLNYCRGFVAVVPRRKDAYAVGGVSPYIAAEMDFARRARLPRLIFAEDCLMQTFATLSPDEPTPFLRESPKADFAVHRRVVREFRRQLEQTDDHRLPRTGLRKACVFLSEDATDSGFSGLVTEVLKGEGFRPEVIPLAVLLDCANDMTALDRLFNSEISVFCLETHLTKVDLALGAAHALCLPAFRLRHDPQSEQCAPDLLGIMRWQTEEQLRPILREQIQCYRHGFCEVVPSAANSYLKPLVQPDDWSAADPPDLLRFIHVDDPHLRQDQVELRERLDSGFIEMLANDRHEELCRATYEQVQGYQWTYDYEPGGKDYSRQRIRSPRELHADRAGTCLDLACCFAAMLESMQANPVIVRVHWHGGAHALAGSWIRNRSGQSLINDRNAIRKALKAGDLILLETTGTARKSTPSFNPIENRSN